MMKASRMVQNFGRWAMKRPLFILLLFCTELFSFTPKKEMRELLLISRRDPLPDLSLSAPSSLDLCHFYLMRQKYSLALIGAPPTASVKISMTPVIKIHFSEKALEIAPCSYSFFFKYHPLQKESSIHAKTSISYDIPSLALTSPVCSKTLETTLSKTSITLEKNPRSLFSFSLSNKFSLLLPLNLYGFISLKPLSLEEKKFSYLPTSFPGTLGKEPLFTSAFGLNLKLPSLKETSLSSLSLPKTLYTHPLTVPHHEISLLLPKSVSLEVSLPIFALSSFPELENVENSEPKGYFARALTSFCPLAIRSEKPRVETLGEPKYEKKIALTVEPPPASTIALQIDALPESHKFTSALLESRVTLTAPAALECKTILFATPQVEENKALFLSIAPLAPPSPLVYTSPIASQIYTASSLDELLFARAEYPSYTPPSAIFSSSLELPFETAPFSFFADKRALSHANYLLGEARDLNRAHRFIQNNLIHLPNLEDLQTDSMGEEFKVSVTVVPQMDRQGFLFSINLTAENPGDLDYAPHHLYFILDPTGPPEYVENFKKAILQTIADLEDSVTYNVLVLQNDLPYLSDKDLYASKNSFNFIKKNLARIRASGPSTFTLLENALTDIGNKASASQDVYTVVLLSNGQFIKNLRSHRESLQNLIENSPSNLALFTTASSDKTNLPMLELLARLGRGELIYSSTTAAFPRKIASTIKKLGQPLAHNLHLTKVSSSPNALFHYENRFAPILYAGKPYTFYGTASKLEDLTFILQGESYGKWLHCTKKVSLKHASKGPSFLEEELATQKALLYISHFITTSDSTSLVEAKRLLAQAGQ